MTEIYIKDCHKLLVVTDLQAVPLLTVLDAIKMVCKDGFEQLQPIIVARASGRCLHYLDSDSMDAVICLCGSFEFPYHQLLAQIAGVLKPGGTILLYLNRHNWVSSIESKIQAYEFVDIQSSDSQPFWVTGKKPQTENGSSSAIKDTPQVQPQVQNDDDVKLMDEDYILANEDSKKRQRPSD